MPVPAVLEALGSGPAGLSAEQAAQRRAEFGPNAVRSHRLRGWSILGHQLRSPLLLLLAATALASSLLGSHGDSAIIGAILLASVGLGFLNEYRAERAAAALHDAISHKCKVVRAGALEELDVVDLVPGDVVELVLGGIVPADLRLIAVSGLSCDEAMLTGESAPVEKRVDPVAHDAALAEFASCALMGTIVRSGGGTGVVVATGGRAEFGRLALALGERAPETDFQLGLRRFSGLLLRVAIALMLLILVANLLLRRPLLDALLFSLAIAVGITPQLLPAVVSTSLAAGSRSLAKRRVLVKRLVCIEDLGDLDLILTDKTGTLTEGRIAFVSALSPNGDQDPEVLRWGLLASGGFWVGAQGAPSGGELDDALWVARPPDWSPGRDWQFLAALPFDHARRLASSLVRDSAGQAVLVTKGAPEAVLDRCEAVPPAATALSNSLAAKGARVVAVATKAMSGDQVAPGDEARLRLCGFLTFRDEPKADAASSLARLAALGVAVKIATGDHPLVAERVCADLGFVSGGTLLGREIDALDDSQLAAAADRCDVFARVSPEQKARLVRVLRHQGRAVGFLGDGVNDALALHAADVGIAVDRGADVAKDAADVVLLDKDLRVLADGITEGRRVFANTIKYVLMGTSSNFGNMFSAAAASAVLPFLPMLPNQILLNNLLYDAGQLTIPTDEVDPEQLRAPSHWDLAMIRRFMLFFGPVSSLFDFLTFAVMLGVFQAGPDEFRSGWFIESLATQTLVILAIRTRRSPFFRSRPSWPLLASVFGVVAIGVVIPLSPIGTVLGFGWLPPQFFGALLLMVITYLLLVEFGKRIFFRAPEAMGRRRPREASDRIARRAARFSHAGRLPVSSTGSDKGVRPKRRRRPALSRSPGNP